MKNKFIADSDIYLNAERLPFSRTKEEAWQAVAARMETAPVISIQSKPSFRLLKVAAVALTLITGAGIGLYFGGITSVDNISENMLAVELPDGSEVSLNGASSLSYNAFLWPISRKVDLGGEAFFEVKKGSQFIVAAEMGRVRVLGTSFNVRVEADEFEVQCKTGRVAVDFANGKFYELAPGNSVLAKAGKAAFDKIPVAEIGRWTEATYNFDDVPVKAVFDRLSKDTGYTFDYKVELTGRYTGEFSRSQKIEDILEIICKPVGLDFEIDRDNSLITILNK